MFNTAGLELHNKAKNLGRTRPEDFARVGIRLECDTRDYSESGEYRQRLRMGLPTHAPRFNVGDWVWDSFHQENMRVLHVEWHHGTGMGWMISTAGHGAPDGHFSKPLDGKPYVERYQMPESPHCWARMPGPAPLTFEQAEAR